MKHICYVANFFEVHADKYIVASSGCWEWVGARHHFGYGKVALRVDGRVRTAGAHRAAYEARNGRGTAEGRFVLHRCHNPSCVNPDHLELGDHAKNMRQMVEAGRSTKGVRNGQVHLSDEAVIEIRRSLLSGQTLSEVARRFGVCHQTIKHCATGSTWSHLGQPIPASSIQYGKGAKRLLSMEKAALVRQRIARGLPARAVASEFGVSISTVYAIKHNRLWATKRVA